jgi:pyruvate-formate lyase
MMIQGKGTTRVASDKAPAAISELRAELTAYYAPLYHDGIARNVDFVRRRDAIWAAMDAFIAAHPDTPACLLKARLHEEIAERCAPVLFRHSPFFFEMGVRAAESWGTPSGWSAASWLLLRRDPQVQQTEPMRWINHFRVWNEHSPVKLWNLWNVFDYDHHCLGYTRLLAVGVEGILAEIVERRRQGGTTEQQAFLEAAERSNRALLRIADRFAAHARARLADETDPQARAFLNLVVDATARVPARPPRSFCEGLAMLWFLREAVASLEGIGISVVGHLDRLLIDLYRADLAAGRLTEATARDLLARWMLPTDVKFHVHDNEWPETSTCMELGGCDADGRLVFNELTRLILSVHRDHHLLNPKPNCRISGEAPQEFLDLIAESTLSGHNNFALLNDDILIPACMRSGKSLREARLYVNGGCQETIVEGVEHSAGAYYYFNLARAFELCLRPIAHQPGDQTLPEAERWLPAPVAAGDSFDAYYQQVFGHVVSLIRLGAGWVRELGRQVPEIQPCPLFSSSLAGCVPRARDYTAGGALYNPSGIALLGFATVVDSLLVIKRAVFDERWLTLDELVAALAANWAGHEALRARVVALPKYGFDDVETNALAGRLSAELAAAVRTVENERGDRFQPSLFVYHMFFSMGKQVRATPDGRHDGEALSQGVAPGRIRPPNHVTDILRSLTHIDFRDFAGNAVLDLQLPVGQWTTAGLASLIRSFARMGGPTLQLNCVSPKELREAQAHPERHAGLIVRIAGLSAHFVALSREVQDEIIGRALVTA